MTARRRIAYKYRDVTSRQLQTQILITTFLAALPVLLLSWPAARELLAGATPQSVLAVAPYPLFAVHALLSLRLHRTCAFFAGLLLAGVTVLLQRLPLPAGPGDSGRLVLQLGAVSVAAPAALLAVYGIGEGALLGARGLGRLAAAAGFPALLLLLAVLRPEWIQLLTAGPLPANLAPWALPDAALLLSAALAAVLAASRGSGRDRAEWSLLWALAPLLWLLDRGIAQGAGTGFAAGTVMTASFLILLYGMYRLYWQQARLDELTAVANRRALVDRLRYLPAGCCLAMFDIDHFKSVNDRYGHAAGDDVLRWVAANLREQFGGNVYRHGGEEFAVLFPRCTLAEAHAAAEGFRARLAGAAFYLRSSQRRKHEGRAARGSARGRRRRLQVTVSAGVARGERRGQEAIERADRALYRAKENGRNRVERAAEAQ